MKAYNKASNTTSNDDSMKMLKQINLKAQQQQQQQQKHGSKLKMPPLTFLMMLLLPLQFLSHCVDSQIVGDTENITGAMVVNENLASMPISAIPKSMRCIYSKGGQTISKAPGSVWISPIDPCIVHTCVLNINKNNPKIYQALTEQRRIDCTEVYCDVDSVLQVKPGVCCGECVLARCRYKNSIYEIGQVWHDNQDCTLHTCTKMESNGQPVIKSYKPTCPPLPKDCPQGQIYTKNCCNYCRVRSVLPRLNSYVADSSSDIWTPEFYRDHPCARTCTAGTKPMSCHYTFVVEWYQTFSKACFDCPGNLTDCNRPHCIMGDGLSRSITVVNRMMPGPSIEVCENDNIIVDVSNNLLGESTTIHWHGLHQKNAPYMDGVPHITQCPISPHTTFRYEFKADNVGTHFWHSHTGMQRGDGVFGALIIRRPKAKDPHRSLYDFDLSEHVMIVQDWVHVPGVAIFADHHHSRGDNKPHTLLINGRGRYYNKIWEDAKSQTLVETRKLGIPKSSTTRRFPTPPRTTPRTTTRATTRATTRTTAKTSTTTSASSTTEESTTRISLEQSGIFKDEMELFESVNNAERVRFKDNNELLRLARLVKEATQLQPVSNASFPVSITPVQDAQNNSEVSLSRLKRANNPNIPLGEIPLQVYRVQQGFRYRFRIINAEFLNCPIVISIDNHSITAINSDGYDFVAKEVGSIVTYAGERFDFILNANQTIGNYWIRLKGLMDCSELFTSAFQVAILRYDSAPAEEPSAKLSYAHKAEGIELNVMNRGSGHADTMTIAELRALPSYDYVAGVDRETLRPNADYKFFVYYDFYKKNNPEFHPGDYYPMDANITHENKVYTPQLNHISLKFPGKALLPSRYELDSNLFCNETSLEKQGIDCRKEFCKCHHVLQVPLNSIVEIILVDEGFTYYANHPFHLHGNAFRVIGLERLDENVTIEMVKQLDHYNLLARNLVSPPIKDTVTVPDGGYTIIRFKAYNPGFWLFHCHIEFHAEIGMALVLKVGDNKQMPPVPKDFPTCSDYIPKEHDTTSSTPSTKTTNKPNTSTDGDNSCSSIRPFVTLIVVLLSILKYRAMLI